MADFYFPLYDNDQPADNRLKIISLADLAGLLGLTLPAAASTGPGMFVDRFFGARFFGNGYFG